ncbi:MAG TPA: hypothetical protein VMW36_05925 [Patescibacteria group bacterium]|nr:hypothetical protein [Patescibacteria group bacterium]
MIDLIANDDFDFWLPMELAKAKKEEKESGRRGIEGIASTIDNDLQNEVVEQRGVDSTYFLKYGYYNNDHKPGFDNKVGQPTDCLVRKEGLWTKGFLWKQHKIADAIWELANALLASQSDRKLGFSIQGKVIRRAGRRILRCWIQDIAITTAPINTNTWLDVAKSLASIPIELWCVGEHGVVYPESTNKSVPCSKSCGNACRSIREEDMDLKKKGTDKSCACENLTCSCGKSEKALGTGSPVSQVESLEGGPTDLDWAGSNEKTKKSMEALMDKPLELEECVSLLSEYRQLNRTDARVVAKAVFAMNGLSD